LANIDERPYARLAEREHGIGGTRIKIGKKCNGRNPRKFTDETCYGVELNVSTSGNRNEDGICSVLTEIFNNVIH
jgi:hypothetical protein